MLTTALSYRLIAGDLDRSLATTAKQPLVARETAYYLENIGNVKSIDDFLSDDRLFKYAMKAFGLKDMDYAKAFMRKALTEGVEDEKSFANKLADPRYREFVEAFNFVRYGEETTTLTRAREGTVDRYMRQTLEETAGTQNEGVRLALYFSRKAQDVDSVFEILGDRALAQVVQTALGLPAAAMAGNIDKLAATISDRIDLEDFKDPAKLEAFIQRFTTMWEVSNPSTPQAAPSLLISEPRQIGLGIDILTSLQNLKIGNL